MPPTPSEKKTPKADKKPRPLDIQIVADAVEKMYAQRYAVTALAILKDVLLSSGTATVRETVEILDQKMSLFQSAYPSPPIAIVCNVPGLGQAVLHQRRMSEHLLGPHPQPSTHQALQKFLNSEKSVVLALVDHLQKLQRVGEEIVHWILEQLGVVRVQFPDMHSWKASDVSHDEPLEAIVRKVLQDARKAYITTSFRPNWKKGPAPEDVEINRGDWRALKSKLISFRSSAGLERGGRDLIPLIYTQPASKPPKDLLGVAEELIKTFRIQQQKGMDQLLEAMDFFGMEVDTYRELRQRSPDGAAATEEDGVYRQLCQVREATLLYHECEMNVGKYCIVLLLLSHTPDGQRLQREFAAKHGQASRENPQVVPDIPSQAWFKEYIDATLFLRNIILEKLEEKTGLPWKKIGRNTV
ncbi:hypothetical protein CC80DRAFT_491479 [Byssothecium circinans]|uniref:Uncharacterized protein n=1 Tax=Byssothecium circinans TaxID=147558 RepID=A0A6A5TY44_9PLEO|nr:hypothetical protein CC80DRAFT_491479 [Byssothecium circinans]